jgi:predicted PurR-regulated permease PerM
MAILLTFLGTFVLLLILFRAVLFPFLIAIFLAYLIEPVVAWFTRGPLLGVRWTRGPTIVFMYAVVLTGIVFSASCAITKTAAQVRKVSHEVGRALAQTSEAAVLGLARGSRRPPQDVHVPAGSRLVLVPQQAPAAPPEVVGPEGPPPEPVPEEPMAPRVFATHHDALLHAGDEGVRVILEPLDEPVPPGALPGSLLDPERLTLADGTALPTGTRVEARGAPPAKGVERWVEKHLLGPIVRNLAAAGYEIEPTEVRAFIREKGEALGSNLGESISRSGASFAIGVAKSLYTFLLVLMLTAFIVMDRKNISAFFSSLPPDRLKPEYASLMGYIDQGLAGVIRGQLMICVVNGILTYVGLLLLGVQGAGPLSVVAGVLSLIPIFGTIVSSIPIVLVAATDGLTTGALALAWIGVIHLLEANLLNPLIMGSNAQMHPVIIVFALLAGEHSFGAWGALLAVPTMSILQSCFLFYRHEIEGIPRQPPRAHGWLGRLMGHSRAATAAAAPTSPPAAPPDASR